MIKYRVSKRQVNIHSGKVKLPESVAKRLAESIESAKGSAGVYEIKQPIQLQKGVEFEYDGDLTEYAVERVRSNPLDEEKPAKAKDSK